MIQIFQIILALIMLFLGRKVFWIFVGAIGFITATEIAASQITAQPEWVIVLIGLLAGIIGALLAVFFQAGAIAVAGVLGGGYLAFIITRYLSVSNPTVQTIAYVIGAVIGLFLFITLFDFALIAISSLSGSLILVQFIDVSGLTFWIFVAGFSLIGILAQLQQLRSSEVSV